MCFYGPAFVETLVYALGKIGVLQGFMQTIAPSLARILHAQGKGDFIIIESKGPVRIPEVIGIPEAYSTKGAGVVGQPPVLDSLN
ncbi:MAG TPA: hypothetical protein DIC57_01545 [Sphaerochaeta sp.]|nr:hypothetical protein [Sphaerochaeta sp.]